MPTKSATLSFAERLYLPEILRGVGVTTRHFVRNLAHFLYMVTEPALRPIRSLLPDLGGIDISPVILMIALIFLEKLIYWLYFQMIT